MKRLIIVAACIISLKAHSQDKLQIQVNKNMELLGLMYTIVYENPNNARYDTTDFNWEYGQSLIKNYGYLGNEETLNQLLPMVDHLWISDFFGLLTQVHDFPNARLSDDISNTSIIHFSEKRDTEEARKIVSKFLSLMNKFYEEISFDIYLEEQQGYYQSAVSEMKVALKTNEFLKPMEIFYQFSYEQYWVFPSLTIPPSMGFSTSHHQEAFAILSAQSEQNLPSNEMGFSDAAVMSDLYIHELGHALLKPAFSRIPDKLFNNTKPAFYLIKESMYHQNYLSWKGVVNEFYTRSGEVIVNRIMNNSVTEYRLFDYHSNVKEFIYLPLFVNVLWSNYQNGGSYHKGMIATLEQLSRDYDQYKKSDSTSQLKSEIKGRVYDPETGSGIPFVHIGVKGKNMGAISKEDGSFEIKLVDYESSDSLFFSSIGYESYSMPISNLDDTTLDVFLSEEVSILDEILVTGREVKEIAKYGRKKPSKRTRGQSNSTSYGVGTEYGIRINIENDTYFIQDINFHMRFNTTDSILFRINIYNIVDNLPHKSILKNDLYMRSYKGQKWVRKDISDQKIVIDEDVIITYEAVKVYFSDKTYNNIFFTFGKGYEAGLQYMKRSSFDEWQTNENDAFPIALFITARIL